MSMHSITRQYEMSRRSISCKQSHQIIPGSLLSKVGGMLLWLSRCTRFNVNKQRLVVGWVQSASGGRNPPTFAQASASRFLRKSITFTGDGSVSLSSAR